MSLIPLLEEELELLRAIARKLDRISSQLDSGRTEGLVDRLYTVDEATALLNISRSWIYGSIHSRKIPYRKVGKYVRFKKSDLEEIMAGG